MKPNQIKTAFDASAATIPIANEMRTELEMSTDKELLKRFIDDDSVEAINEFVSRHSAKVMAVCRANSRCHADADDAFQATFLAAVTSSSRLLRVTSHGGWLCRVAYNASLKANKLRYREKNLDEEARQLESIPDPLPETWELIEGRESERLLIHELLCLPKQYQDCLILFYFDGVSRSETASRLGKSPSSVKALLQRGRQMLKTRLLKRGVAPSMALLGIALTARSAGALETSSLIASTVQIAQASSATASAGIPAGVQRLSEVASRLATSNVASAKLAVAIAFAVSLVGVTILGAIGIAQYERHAVQLAASQEREQSGEPITLTGEYAADQLQTKRQIIDISQKIAVTDARVKQLETWTQHKQEFIEQSNKQAEISMLAQIVNEMQSESSSLEIKLGVLRKELNLLKKNLAEGD